MLVVRSPAHHMKEVITLVTLTPEPQIVQLTTIIAVLVARRYLGSRWTLQIEHTALVMGIVSI